MICVAALASSGVMQVVLSYLESQPFDIRSTEAAFEAYFAQPLQQACDQTLASLPPQTIHLKEAICQALDALHTGNSTAVQRLCYAYPAAQALEALQTAVGIASTRLEHSWDSANMLAASATAAESGTSSAYLAPNMGGST